MKTSVFSASYSENSDEPALTVLGEPVDKEVGVVFGKENSLWVLISGYSLPESIASCSFGEIAEGINLISFEFSQLSVCFNVVYIDSMLIRRKKNLVKLEFRFYFEVDRWQYPFTIPEYLQLFHNTSSERMKGLGLSLTPGGEGVSWTEFTPYVEIMENDQRSAKATISEMINIFREVGDDTLSTLSKQGDLSTFIQRFEFPEAVKTSCEQYLLYFTDFLKDVGIEASASLTEEAGSVLFSVTPADRDEALENIRTALALYLQLPNGSSANSSQLMEANIAAQRLSAQVQFLKSQIILANATTQQQSFLIDQQNQFIQSQQFSTQVLLDSAQDETNDKEALVRDVVSVKDWGWGPFTVEFPELIRRMKEYFRKN